MFLGNDKSYMDFWYGGNAGAPNACIVQESTIHSSYKKALVTITTSDNELKTKSSK